MQVSVGVGTLAGSTIMLLTIAWGGSLLVGRCDLNERVRDNQLLGEPLLRLFASPVACMHMSHPFEG